MGSLERQLQHITDFFSSNQKRSLPQNNETHSDHHNRDQFTVTRTIKSVSMNTLTIATAFLNIYIIYILFTHDCIMLLNPTENMEAIDLWFFLLRKP